MWLIPVHNLHSVNKEADAILDLKETVVRICDRPLLANSTAMSLTVAIEVDLNRSREGSRHRFGFNSKEITHICTHKSCDEHRYCSFFPLLLSLSLSEETQLIPVPVL